MDTWSDFLKERTRFPIKLNICGLRETEGCCFRQFFGAMLQSTVVLITRPDSKHCLIEGARRLITPANITFFGEGSLEQCSSQFLGGVTNNDQAMDIMLLLTQYVIRVGVYFYVDGTVAASVKQ